MSQVFEIKSVSDPKEWEGKFGPMLSYKLDLDLDGSLARGVELNRKPESRAPQVGELIAGHLEEGKFGEKLKIDFEATKELKQSGGSPSPSSEASSASHGKAKGNWQPEAERDPERAARILRQHSQGLALQWLIAEGAKNIDLDDFYGVCDELDRDVIRAGQRAVQASGTPPSQESALSSRDAHSPASEQPPAEDLKDLEMALDTAEPLPAKAREEVARYMQTQLSPEDLTRACNQLTNSADLETQGMTMRAMKQRTEKHIGGPLPSDSPGGPMGSDDDIPFARPEYRELFSERERWRF